MLRRRGWFQGHPGRPRWAKGRGRVWSASGLKLLRRGRGSRVTVRQMQDRQVDRVVQLQQSQKSGRSGGRREAMRGDGLQAMLGWDWGRSKSEEGV